MRIALVNVVYKKGSTGQIVHDLANAYRRDGHEVFVLYGRGQKISEPHVYKTGYEFEANLHHAISSVSGNMYGGMFFSTLKIKRLLRKINPDVVHLHCLNGYFVNIPSLIAFLKKRKVKVILTNHADFMFTANCGYSLWCEKWKSEECRKCPRVKEFNGRFSLNRTHRFYLKMKKAFEGAKNFDITAVSPWLAKRCQIAPMFKGISVTSILNGVKFVTPPANIENPYLSIKANEATKIVLHVTSGFHYQEKGGHYIYPLADKLKDENIRFVVIGNSQNETDTTNIKFLGRVNGPRELAKNYANADVSLLLSEAETFSMIVAESLVQGTPVVGFEAGGPESITLEEHSAFVKHGDVEALAKAIKDKINQKTNRPQIISEAKEKYGIDKSKNAYSALFVDQGNKRQPSLLHSLRDRFHNFLKSKKADLVNASALFAYFLLTALSSASPFLYASGSFGTIYRLITFALFSIATFLIAIMLKSRPSMILGGLLFVYLLIGLGISFLNPYIVQLEVGGVPTIIFFNFADSIDNLARTLGIVIMVFCFASVLPEVFKRKQSLKIFLFLVAAFSLIATLYASVFQFDTIINSFIAEGENAHFYQVKSFFASKNLYGLMVFIGMLALTYCFVDANKKTRIGIIITFLWLGVHLVISRNKTAILLVMVAALAIFIYWLITSFKKHPKRSWSIIGVVAALVLVATLFLFVPALHPAGTFLDTIHHYFYQNFILIGLRTIGTRFDDLSRALPLFASWKIIFGYGEEFVYRYFEAYTGMTSIDNAYLAIALTGGLAKSALFVYLYVLSFKKISSLWKQNRNSAFLLTVIQITILAQGFSESLYILRTDAFALIFLVFAFLLPNVEILENREQRIAKHESKRVLHVVASLNKGGTESFILGYAELLKNDNIIFDIYCYGAIDPSQKERIEKLGGNIYQGSAPSKRGYLKAQSAFSAFLDHHDEYIAIHTNCNFDSEVFLRVARDYGFANRVFHAHDTLTGIAFSKVQRAIMDFKRLSFTINASAFAACSSEAGHDIIGSSIFDEYGVVIHNLVNKDRFLYSIQKSVARQKLGLPEDAYIIGNITRFEDKKNQAFIVNLFADIAHKNDKAFLVLGGPDGGTMQQIATQVEKLQLKNRVLLVGAQSDVPLWLHAFDLYLFPSLFEGFGIVVIENQLASLMTFASERVPSSTDLGLGLVKFISLQNRDEWCENILNHQNKILDAETIEKALKRKGFDPLANQATILKLYK